MCRVKINKAFYPKLPWNLGHLPKKKGFDGKYKYN